MAVLDNTKTKLSSVILLTGQDAQLLSLVLSTTSILLALGFLVGDSYSHNYEIMIELANPLTWSAIFFAYGIIKACQLLSDIPHTAKIFGSIIGCWLWIYMFLSFVVFDEYVPAPAEFLILLPLACEAWELVLDIFNFRYCPKRKPSI